MNATKARPAGDRPRSRVPTATQLCCLQLMAQGHTDEEIAALLGMKYNTARTHSVALLARMGARSRAHAVAMAYRANWWQPSTRPSNYEAVSTVLRHAVFAGVAGAEAAYRMYVEDAA